MKKKDLQVALIQSDIIWENPTQNRLHFTYKISEIKPETDIIVLPEMFSTGFTMNVDLAETMTGHTVIWMQNIAQQQQTAITGSIIIKENGKYYNRLLFVHPNGKIEYYDKHHLFTLSGENKVFTAGLENKIVNYKGWKISLQICYDLRFPEWSRNIQNYDILLYVASWPKKRINAWDALLKARAIENMSYTIGVNRVGIDNMSFEYSGNSVVIDALGNTLANFKPNTEGALVVRLEKQHQDDLRESLGFLKDLKI